jgi:hypothetical protein
VPGPAVGVGTVAERLGQCPVRGASFVPGGGLVNGRTDQRVTDPDGVELGDQEPGTLRGVDGAGIDAQ